MEADKNVPIEKQVAALAMETFKVKLLNHFELVGIIEPVDVEYYFNKVMMDIDNQNS